MLDRKIAASLEFLAAHVRGRRIGLIRENRGNQFQISHEPMVGP